MAHDNDKKINREKEDDFALLEFSQKSSKQKRRLKSLLLLLFNILVIAVIIIIEFTGKRERVDIGTVLVTWGENWYFIVVLFALVAMFYLCKTLKLNLLIRSATGRHRLKLSFSTAMLGRYYDYITPFGSGGQPFQMFNLGRKLDMGLATSIPIADYVIHQFVFVLIALIVFIVNSGVMVGNEFLKIAAYIGLVVFSAIPLAALVLSVFPKAISVPAKFFCRVGHKLHLVKNLEKAETKIDNGVVKYSTSIKLVSKKQGYLILSACLSLIAWLSYHSLPYFVLRACGVSANYFDAVCMSVFVFAAVVVVPTPGGAGASEGAFYAIFKSLSGGFLFWGTMLWRFSMYYMTLIIGFSITIYQYVHAARKEKRLAARRPQVAAWAEVGESVSDNLPRENLPKDPQEQQTEEN